MRLRTRGLSFPKIAAELGCSVGTAHNSLKRAMERAIVEINEHAPALRAAEAQKLEDAAQAIFPRVLEGDARAHDTWLRNRARYASLLGLDLKPPDVTVDQSQNVIVLPAWGEQPPTVDSTARELGSSSGVVNQSGRNA